MPITRSPSSTSSLVSAAPANDLDAFARFCEGALTTEAGRPFVLEGFQREYSRRSLRRRPRARRDLPKKERQEF